jgi:tRNA nucleotidyltransferase (CCA-adding enzyme)
MEKKPDIKIKLPVNLKVIIEKLEKAGYEAFAVGGCVRDSILNKKPKDWDVTTDAKPEEVKSIFGHTVDTGIKHGTVTVVFKENDSYTGYEVTTYRIDGEYADHRHPDKVNFTGVLSDDLRRRDFTINAMAYNEKSGLIDLYGGYDDIKMGIIRAVGNPDERFNEDVLRIMRAVRFSAQLNFDIDPDTIRAVRKHAHELEMVSKERINAELTKILISDHPDKILTLYITGITKVILPEFDVMMDTSQHHPHHIYSVGMHTVKVLTGISEQYRQKKYTYEEHVILAYCALLHDSGKPFVKTTDSKMVDHFYGHPEKSAEIAEKVLKRLKFDNNTIYYVKLLIYNHDNRFQDENGNLSRTELRKGAAVLGRRAMPLMFELQRADMRAQNPAMIPEKMEQLDACIKEYENILEKGECISKDMLAVSGKDLISEGIKPGEMIGSLLDKLFNLVIQNPEMNKKEELLEIVRKECRKAGQ